MMARRIAVIFEESTGAVDLLRSHAPPGVYRNGALTPAGIVTFVTRACTSITGRRATVTARSAAADPTVAATPP